METKDLLAERGKTHGDFTNHAKATQELKLWARDLYFETAGSPWDRLNKTQREALDMIFHKIGRILAGDPDFRDHWDDIAGYAKLVADRCTK